MGQRDWPLVGVPHTRKVLQAVLIYTIFMILYKSTMARNISVQLWKHKAGTVFSKQTVRHINIKLCGSFN
jgi:hypothetical protein